MNQSTRRQLELRTKIIKALAHPTRLFIVQTLSEGEQCVCKLTEMIGTDISTVSKHLSLLRNAGIIEHEKRKNQIFYSLKTPCILNFLKCVENVFQEAQEREIQAA